MNKELEPHFMYADHLRENQPHTVCYQGTNYTFQFHGPTLGSYAAQEAGLTFKELECGTPCLVVSGNPLEAHRWVTVKSLLNPE